MCAKGVKILLPPLSTKIGFFGKPEFFRDHYATGDDQELRSVG
jgi:hypothetical protein